MNESQIWTPQNGAHRKPFPAATPSWKLAPRPRIKHEKRTAGSAWETWTVAAADGVRCARVRWEISFLLTFETAPFFCVYPVYPLQQVIHCTQCVQRDLYTLMVILIPISRWRTAPSPEYYTKWSSTDIWITSLKTVTLTLIYVKNVNLKWLK